MKETTKKPNDAEILQSVLDALDITASKLADKAGYKSKSSIYHILNGTNQISIDMAKKICGTYPKVNLLFLTTGEGPVLLPEGFATSQSNLLKNYGQGKHIDEEILTRLEKIENWLEKIHNKL